MVQMAYSRNKSYCCSVTTPGVISRLNFKKNFVRH